jgi:hypothetical protein
MGVSRRFVRAGCAFSFLAGAAFVLLTAVSFSYVALFVAGVVVAWRRRLDLAIPAMAILFVPWTVRWFFSEMRYSLTVLAFEFLLMTVAVVAVFDGLRRPSVLARV